MRGFDKNGKGLPSERKIVRKRFNKETRHRVWHRTDGCCYLCKVALPLLSSWHIEHIFAFSKDPKENDVVGNLLPSCPPCNRKKSDKCLLECMTCDGFSIHSTMNVSAMSLQPRVKRVLLAAIALKRARRGTELPSTDDELAEWCDGTDKALECRLDPYDIADVKNLQLLARSGQAKVWSGELVLRTDVRVSVAAKECTDVSYDVERERAILRKLADSPAHPGLVSYFGVIEGDASKPNSNFFFLMELMDGDVHDEKGANAFVLDAASNTAMLVSAIRFLHERSIIHRDVKPRNILYKRDPNRRSAAIKLADIGLARFVGTEMSMGAGTGVFRAPEVKHGTNYTTKADIFSLGKTLQHIIAAGPSITREDHALLHHLAQRCHSATPQSRPSADEIYEELCHQPPPTSTTASASSSATASRASSPPPAPAPPSMQSSLPSTVYVANKSDIRGKFHISKACCGTYAITLSVARKEGRLPCGFCVTSDIVSVAPTSVFVTSTTDKRGAFHSRKGC